MKTIDREKVEIIGEMLKKVVHEVQFWEEMNSYTWWSENLETGERRYPEICFVPKDECKEHLINLRNKCDELLERWEGTDGNSNP